MQINLVYRHQRVINGLKDETFLLVKNGLKVTEHSEMYKVSLDHRSFWSMGGIEVRTPAGDVVQSYPEKIETKLVDSVTFSNMAYYYLSGIIEDTGNAPYIAAFNKQTMQCDRYYMLESNSLYEKNGAHGSLNDIFQSNIDGDRDFPSSREEERISYRNLPIQETIDGLFCKVESLDNIIPVPCKSRNGKKGTQINLVHSVVENARELVITGTNLTEAIPTGIWIKGRVIAVTNKGNFDITDFLNIDNGDLMVAVIAAYGSPVHHDIAVDCIKVDELIRSE